MMAIMKRVPEKLYRIIDFLFAENDGINTYEKRSGWNYNKKKLIDFFQKQGFTKIYTYMDEVFGIWEEVKN